MTQNVEFTMTWNVEHETNIEQVVHLAANTVTFRIQLQVIQEKYDVI